MKKSVLIIISLVFITLYCCKPASTPKATSNMDEEKWADSIYYKMSLEEKVGQLFMVAAYSNRDINHYDSIRKMIKTYHLGGLVFFQGGPVRQAVLTNDYQSVSKIPLMIGIDAEWGINMRLDSTFRYPYNMTLGAVEDNDLLRKIGVQIGKHSKRLGVHVNFAPVVDINTNPNNPIIGVRSYGEEKKNVADKAVAFTKGLQNEDVLASAKHFPGHGDTDTDSHKTLPTVLFNSQRIDSVELYPFKRLFDAGIASVMVAHLNVPSLESSKGLPSSLSHHIITDILKEDLAFEGLIFTDALDMKGASNYKEPGNIDLAAFEAGNDVLLLSENIPKATSKIIAAYKNGRITESRLGHSVKKILRAKFRVHLNEYQPIRIDSIMNDINTKADRDLYTKVVGEAITLIKNNDSVLSMVGKRNKKTAYIKLGNGRNSEFLKVLQEKLKVDDLTWTLLKKDLKKLEKYDMVIISYHQSNPRRLKQLSDNDLFLIQEIAKKNNVILDIFASQYSLAKLKFNNIETVIISYENSEVFQILSAQIILGTHGVKGKLPASINDNFRAGHGILINNSIITN